MEIRDTEVHALNDLIKTHCIKNNYSSDSLFAFSMFLTASMMAVHNLDEEGDRETFRSISMMKRDFDSQINEIIKSGRVDRA